MKKDINMVFKMIKQINKQLEQYNKSLSKVIKQNNYPIGITYDQLSREISQTYKKGNYEEIKIKRIE